MGGDRGEEGEKVRVKEEGRESSVISFLSTTPIFQL